MKKRKNDIVGMNKWTEEVLRLLAEPQPAGAPKVINGFRIPKWWECAWRRIPCKRSTCSFCGRLRKLGFGPEMRDEQLEDSEENFKEMVEVLRYQAKDLGIPPEMLLGGREITEDDFDDNGKLIETAEEEEWEENRPPEAETFLLYRRVKCWSAPISRYVYLDEHKNEVWAKTEAVRDLTWYASLTLSKVYRQLTTRWEMTRARKDADEEELEFGKIETVYTGYVIREMISIIERSLIELSKENMHPPFMEVLKNFRRLKPSILAIAPKR